MTDEEKGDLLDEIDAVDFGLVNQLYSTLVEKEEDGAEQEEPTLEAIDPSMVVSSEQLLEDGYFQIGLDQIKKGKSHVSFWLVGLEVGLDSNIQKACTILG